VKKRISLLWLLVCTGGVVAKINDAAEQYLSVMLTKKVPYSVRILGRDFVVTNVNAYPPGKLTELFAQYLVDNAIFKDKVVADIGCGCCALGIIAAHNGARAVIGTDVSEYAIQSARENAELNKVREKVQLVHEKGASHLLAQYAGTIDVIVAGVPWDSVSTAEYEQMAPERKALARSFYDVNDELLDELMTVGFELLAADGRMFVTSSKRVFDRIQTSAAQHGRTCRVVKEADLHGDGNMHYIVEILRA